ncbi:hypothetical protein MKW92_023318, partial [Papaver armeniacum]
GFFFLAMQIYEIVVDLTLRVVKEDAEPVSLQAIEFWSSICDEEIEIQEYGGDESVHSCFIEKALTSLVPMLLETYWIDFSKWEVFVNDEQTRSFLVMEVVAGGLAEITRQIQSVNEIYRFHNLPEFYKDPRPHISLAWASGNVSDLLKKRVMEDLSAST